MPKSSFKRCYYCGCEATSKEHAPPQQLLKYFQCDSITVPSCDVHNGDKSGRDQAVIHRYFKSLLGYQEKLEPEGYKALLNAIGGFDYTKKTVFPAHLIKNPKKSLQKLPKIAYVTKENKIHNWIKKLSSAIIFDATQSYDSSIPWDDLQIFSPNWVPAKDPQGLDLNKTIEILQRNEQSKIELEKLPWQLGWSAHPRPYPQKIYSKS